MTAPTCRGFKRDPHETRYVYNDGLCDGCRTRKAADVDPIEPPDPEPATGRDDDLAADAWERAQGRRWA